MSLSNRWYQRYSFRARPILKPSRESNSQDLRLLDLVLIITKHPGGGIGVSY